MNQDNFKRIYGLSAEALQALCKIAGCLENLNGFPEDIRQLNNPKVIKRVAEMLARAGNLQRSFSVRILSEDWTLIYLGPIKPENFGDIPRSLTQFNCRLASEFELRDLIERNPDLLLDEKELIIIGSLADVKNKEEILTYWQLTAHGLFRSDYHKSQPLSDNMKCAIVFNK